MTRRRWNKVLVVISEDWFAVSHFKPLLSALQRLAGDVVLVARCAEDRATLEALGVRVVHLDFHRKSLDPRNQLATAHMLEAILKEERPDVLHLVALLPIVTGCLASWRVHPQALVLHVTGLGHLFISSRLRARAVRFAVTQLIRYRLHHQPSWILAENPDDLIELRRYGIDATDRTTILGGAGIDPGEFPEMPQPNNAVPRAAYIGRLIRSKGIDVVIAAHDILARRGIELSIDLYGRHDLDNPEALNMEVIKEWARRPNVHWHGQTSDVPTVWRWTDIAIMPARTREGMPRALLEAASCGRPLVVSDVPGPRHFLTDGTEGLLVPPDDAPALADALQRLIEDPNLRQRMGSAARRRLVGAFTCTTVEAEIESAYARL